MKRWHRAALATPVIFTAVACADSTAPAVVHAPHAVDLTTTTDPVGSGAVVTPNLPATEPTAPLPEPAGHGAAGEPQTGLTTPDETPGRLGGPIHANSIANGPLVVDVGDVLACIRAHESDTAGGYRAVNPNGHYGAYQFAQSTWESVGGTGNPADASPAEQDDRAAELLSEQGTAPWGGVC